MPTRFDRYRMRDGETELSAGYFNSVFGDIDLRIAKLEAIKISWDAAVGDITRFGLERINIALAPTLDQASALLDQLLNDAANFRAALMADIQPLLDPHGDPSAVAYIYDASGLVTGVTEQLPAGERVSVTAYDAQGRVATVTQTFAGIESTSTYTYDGAGALTGVTRTETPL